MDRLGRVWTRLSVRRTRAAPVPDAEEDEELPDTKNEVFQMFSNKSHTHRKSAAELRKRQTTGAAGSSKSISPQRSKVVEHLPAIPKRIPSGLETRLTRAPSPQPHLPWAKSTDMPGSIEASKRAAILNQSNVSTEGDKVSKRRNSVFVKRGSVSMEPIKKVEIDAVYSVYKQLGTGRFGFIKLAEHKQSKQKIAIKFFPRPQTKQTDFIREYNYSFFLSPHQNIIDSYEGMFVCQDDAAFFFVQEFCPRASLREALESANGQGLGESNTKKIFGSVLSAIEFMHTENLVHRNLKPENILVFDSLDYTKVKVTDFGLTRKVDSTVKYLEYVNQYHAPELCETVVNEVLIVHKSFDVWSLGVIFFYCIRGKLPWQKATIMCKPYWEWEQWLKRKNPTLPKKWVPFSEKALKLCKKSLTPRIKDRWAIKDMRKCIAKEKLLKPVKSDSKDDFVYLRTEAGKSESSNAEGRKKSALQHWISTTLSTMAEISEQVVSARDD